MAGRGPRTRSAPNSRLMLEPSTRDVGPVDVDRDREALPPFSTRWMSSSGGTSADSGRGRSTATLQEVLRADRRAGRTVVSRSSPRQTRRRTSSGGRGSASPAPASRRVRRSVAALGMDVDEVLPVAVVRRLAVPRLEERRVGERRAKQHPGARGDHLRFGVRLPRASPASGSDRRSVPVRADRPECFIESACALFHGSECAESRSAWHRPHGGTMLVRGDEPECRSSGRRFHSRAVRSRHDN